MQVLLDKLRCHSSHGLQRNILKLLLRLSYGSCSHGPLVRGHGPSFEEGCGPSEAALVMVENGAVPLLVALAGQQGHFEARKLSIMVLGNLAVDRPATQALVAQAVDLPMLQLAETTSAETQHFIRSAGVTVSTVFGGPYRARSCCQCFASLITCRHCRMQVHKFYGMFVGLLDISRTALTRTGMH